ncbi:hypothetical protein BDA99DRAFT_515293 [Phascolomyces articulosus]|uniref:F-box domain-containing protein n=1 Tax=Phascolomyces articulosus TaxID=60185 RepID=A0AAD5JX48_9FUNG|nr:hypothetical protein BDA99DRAFT_515293 [Phascolomyces articulosus]
MMTIQQNNNMISHTIDNTTIVNRTATTTTTRRIQLNDLFTGLPYEVLCSIFSHLSQGDLVLCMSLHPTLATYIPLYAKSKLSTFEFQSDTLKFPQCWMGLGPHVDTVIMHQLMDPNCVNNALEILVEKRCFNIKKLKLSECRVSHLETFIQLLQQLDQRESLRELTFELHRDQMPYRHIMSACPKLTHFSCDLEEITFEPKIQPQQQPSSITSTTTTIPHTLAPKTIMSHLTYLSVNILLQRDNRLYPILEMCPQLTCLVLGYGFFVHDGDPYRWVKPIELGTILQLCPKIAYFQCNSWENNPAWIMHAKHASRNNNEHGGGLREFITDHVGMYDSQQIMPLLLQHRHSIQVMKLGNVRHQQRQNRDEGEEPVIRSWLHSLEEMEEHDYYFDQLHTLMLKNIEMAEGDQDEALRQMVRLIRRCPNLQEIGLDGWIVHGQVLDAIATTCPYLRRLDLKKGSMSFSSPRAKLATKRRRSEADIQEEQQRTAQQSLIHLVTHGCTLLQSIQLIGFQWVTDDLLLPLVNGCFQEIVLADLPNITSFGMEQFARQMVILQKNSNNNDNNRMGMRMRNPRQQRRQQLRILMIKDMQVVTRELLDALSQSNTLHTLQLCRCGVLPDDGLEALLADDNAKKMKKLCIDCCTVSYDVRVQIRKRFGTSSIKGLPEYWPE